MAFAECLFENRTASIEEIKDYLKEVFSARQFEEPEFIKAGNTIIVRILESVKDYLSTAIKMHTVGLLREKPEKIKEKDNEK